ncbi:MAG: Do family serine endopeptidase, partial [Vicinamibacteria bacterium]
LLALCGASYALGMAVSAIADSPGEPEQNEATGRSTSASGLDESELSQMPAEPDELSLRFESVSRSIGPAVVNIYTLQGAPTEATRFPPTPFPGFEDFFERFFDGPLPSSPRQSLGSGVIVDPSGIIVTNNHVISDADEIRVRLASEERDYEGEVIGADELTDLAVIRIEAGENLPTAELAGSEELAIGEWVLAVGNPFGVGQTVTAGIVSATGRSLGQGPFDDFIQTDAAINPGNSGGPLVDLSGRVIGINTAIFSSSGGNMGIGFAIPSGLARTIYAQLVEQGEVRRGWLGVSVQNLTRELAESFGIPDQKGALVSGVVSEDAPAARAGLKPGDVIVELEEHPIQSAIDLTRAIAAVSPGSTVRIEYLRDGGRTSTTVELARRDEPVSAPDLEVTGPGGERSLGIQGRGLTPQLRAELGIETDAGVVIESVIPESAAADAGLEPGDVIVQADRRAVTSPEELRAAILGLAERENLLLLLERPQLGMLWVTVPIGESTGR